MTESTVTLFEEFTQSLRRNVSERDEALEALDNNYAKDLAAGAAGNLHPSYLAERALVVNKFKLEAISIWRDYTHRAPPGSPPLPVPPSPSAAYPPPHGETMPAMTDHRPVHQPEVRKRRFSQKAKLIGFVSAGILTLGLIFTGYSIISNNPTIDKDAVFLKLVHANYNPVVSDSDLMEMAKAACATLKDGHTKKDIEKLVAGTDQSQSKRIEMATIIGYGIGVYCPEFS